jgi:hypothetical protein
VSVGVSPGTFKVRWRLSLSRLMNQGKHVSSLMHSSATHSSGRVFNIICTHCCISGCQPAPQGRGRHSTLLHSLHSSHLACRLRQAARELEGCGRSERQCRDCAC